MVTKLEGTPQEVAAKVSALMADKSISQKSHAVAVVMIDDATAKPAATPEEFEQLMIEAAPDTVSVGHMDDSREAMYTRMDGE